MTCITMWDTVYQMKSKNIPLSRYFICIISITQCYIVHAPPTVNYTMFI